MSKQLVAQYVLDPEITYVKVHGLQRSGTNYAAYLINENFDKTKALVNAGGWKHGHYCAPWVLGTEVHVLVVYKHPYEWLVSLYNYWKDNPVGMDLSKTNFAQFVMNPAIFEEAQGIPYLYKANNPVIHWNSMYFHWNSIRTNTKTVSVIPYGSLLNHTWHVLADLGQRWQVRQKTTMILPDKKVIPSEETVQVGIDKFDAASRNAHKFMEMYTAGLLTFVNEQLDKQVMANLGCDYITT